MAQNNAGMVSHKRLIHSIVPDIDYYVSTKWCPVCFKQWDTIALVRKHLSNRKLLCRKLVLQNMDPMPDDLMERTKHIVALQRKQYVEMGYRETKVLPDHHYQIALGCSPEWWDTPHALPWTHAYHVRSKACTVPTNTGFALADANAPAKFPNVFGPVVT